MKKKICPSATGCPIGCRYCVVTKVASRRTLWQKRTILGLNKAATIFNAPPDKNDPEAMAEFYHFPVEMFHGDIVSFNAVSDPFWPKYQPELEYFLTAVAPVAKLVVGVTKFILTDEMLKRLSQVPNFRLIVSITGLDQLEKTKTVDRLDLLRRAKKFGVKAFPLIHPYIAGVSALSFLPELKKLGYDFVDVKGFRYNSKTMNWLPAASRKYYEKSKEKEILPEDGWREKIQNADLTLVPLKDWYALDLPTEPKLSPAEAKEKVSFILKYANITSSDTRAAVICAAIKRRQ
jgi:DNA repair photolyase